MSAEGYITDVAYIPGFYGNMAPVLLRYAATLNRVTPPRVAGGFRYLELGCGLGRTLTTLAAANPAGEFVGIDVNPEHTAAVGRQIAEGGLANARVITADFAHLPPEVDGQFDFITLHGIFSWVGPEVRDAILAIARERLAPGGLLLVSYNAMPGWAHLQPIRGILRQYAALRGGDSVQKVRDAVAYLTFLRDKHAAYFDDNPRAAASLDALVRQDVRYVAHEYLNEHWTTFYFAEVAAAFRGAGLGFVGSLPVHTNFWDLCVRPEFQELFRTTGDRLITEAHKDFCANTSFRWDIYARSVAAMPAIEDRLREADDLHFRVARAGLTLPYSANLGMVTSTARGPLYEALVALLSERSLRLSEILASSAGAGRPPAEVAHALDAGVAMGLFEVTAGPVSTARADLTGAVRLTLPINAEVLRTEALRGRPVALASTVSGTGHLIGDLEAAILDELVGRGRDGLADRVDARLAASGRLLQADGKPVTDEPQRKELVSRFCRAFLDARLADLATMEILAPG